MLRIKVKSTELSIRHFSVTFDFLCKFGLVIRTQRNRFAHSASFICNILKRFFDHDNMPLRESPAAKRNRVPIAEALSKYFSEAKTDVKVLEIASGCGTHAMVMQSTVKSDFINIINNSSFSFLVKNFPAFNGNLQIFKMKASTQLKLI